MAIPHAKPGEIVDARPLGSALASAQTKTVVGAEQVEAIRLVDFTKSYREAFDDLLAEPLVKGMAMLAKRVARHGVVLSGGSLAAMLSHDAASASG